DAGIKFYEHFVLIAEALNELGLWNEDDHFFYDVLCLNDQRPIPLKVRSIIGLIPLFAVSTITKEQLEKLTDFNKRMDWLKEYRTVNHKYLPNEQKNDTEVTLLSLVHKDRLVKLLERMLDHSEFLSNNGVRSLSKYYEQAPYNFWID